MAEKIVIAQLDLDVDALIKSTSDVKKVIDQLKEAQKNLAKQGDTNSEQFVQNVADLKVLNSAYNSNLKAISDSVNAKAEETNRTALLSLALQAEATSIKEAREQNSLLNKLRNETNVTTEEGKKELEALNKKLDENNAFIKENADQYLQQKINIGNYSESIKEAFQDLNIFNGGLSGFIGRAQQAGGVLPLLSNGVKAVTSGIVGMTRATLTFLATPIGAVIGAIGLALGALISFLKNTQGGIDAVTAVTRPLQAVLQAVGTVVTKVGKALFEAFSNPKKTLIELGEFVKQNLINRFTAFGKILEGIITLDFAKIGDGVLQAGTGVENLTGKIQDTAKATGDLISNAVKIGQEIDRLTKEIERDQLAYNRAVISTNDLIDEQKLIIKDTSKSFAERGAAAEEQIRLTEELSKKEAEIVQKKIKALELEYSLKDAKELTIEEQQKLIDLEKELDDAEDRGLEARLENARVLSGLKKEQQAEAEAQAKAEADRQQKILDDAVAISKAQLDLFISEQGIKAKSLEEGLKLAEQIAQKQIAINQKVFDASKKTEADRLALQTANNEARNILLQAQADAVIANVDRELQIFKDANKTQLDDKKFLTEELANEEINRLNRIAEEEAEAQTQRLINGQITEAQYQDAIKAIDEKFYQDKLAIEQQRKDAEALRKSIDLENTLLEEGETFRQRLEREVGNLNLQREEELKNADKTGADKAKINAKYDKQILDLRTATRNAELALTQNVLGQIAGLLKENTVLAKTLSIAEATINTYLGATKALATLPPPYGAIQAGITIATGLGQVAKIAGIKFEKGGTMEVGGNRHAQGGTKFVGSDGSRFEAEKGELIGVLNRNASSAFMSFNDAFGSKGKVGTTYAQTGGIIARGMDSGVADLAQLAVLTADAVSQIPAPIVTVEDINTVGNRVNVIENGANF
jgi:hypothetical protein